MAPPAGETVPALPCCASKDSLPWLRRRPCPRAHPLLPASRAAGRSAVCASPAQFNAAETLSTLRFGQRAKSIRKDAVTANAVEIPTARSSPQLPSPAPAPARRLLPGPAPPSAEPAGSAQRRRARSQPANHSPSPPQSPTPALPMRTRRTRGCSSRSSGRPAPRSPSCGAPATSRRAVGGRGV